MKFSVKYFLIITLFLVLPLAWTIAQYGGEAPVISGVKIMGVDEETAIVEWQTDKETDATVNYGLNENHGLMRDPLFNKKKHTITIDKLEPSTTYHFRVVSSDPEGNRSTSAGYVFTTKGVVGASDMEEIEEIKSAEERALVEKTFAILGKITSAEAISLIAQEVGEKLGELVAPPVVIGAPKVIADTTSAEIAWLTDKAANSIVSFVSEDGYQEGSADPYAFSQGDLNELVTEHLVKIIGLNPSTTYHFKVSSEDELGLKGESLDDTFKTKSILPQISNIRIIKVQETSATIGWNTDVPADGLISYTNTRTGEVKSAGDPTFATSHTIQLNGLEFGTMYSAIIKSINDFGDDVISDPITFITVKDEVAPIISKVSNDSTLFPGDEVRIQTIVGWETDEPALCQFFYSQGLAGSKKDNEDSMDEETNPVVDHVQVIVGLSPATVYRFWMVCKDGALNQVRSEDFVLFTPIKEKSIIDIIIENFQGTFGWVKNITG